jgi:hypothetical protein
MFLLDSLLVGGLRFVLDKIAAAADQELNDETSLREQLLAAQLRLELGELTTTEFAALEAELLARLREIREDRETEGELRVTGVDASVVEGDQS